METLASTNILPIWAWRRDCKTKKTTKKSAIRKQSLIKKLYREGFGGSFYTLWHGFRSGRFMNLYLFARDDVFCCFFYKPFLCGAFKNGHYCELRNLIDILGSFLTPGASLVKDSKTLSTLNKKKLYCFEGLKKKNFLNMPGDKLVQSLFGIRSKANPGG